MVAISKTCTSVYSQGGAHVICIKLILYTQGNMWSTHGHMSEGELFLDPLEALYLLEHVSC